MELDALRTNQNAAAQMQQQVKTEQTEQQVRRPVVKAESNPTKTRLSGKPEYNPLKAGAKAADDSGVIFNQDPEDAKADRISNDALDKAIEQVNQKLIGFNSECQFSVHKQTGLVNIKIYNSDTKELLREIPPIKRLDAIAKMWELAGLIVDEKR